MAEERDRALLARHLRVLASAVNVEDWPAYLRSVAAGHEAGTSWYAPVQGAPEEPEGARAFTALVGRLNDILREAGIEYPLGLRGVRDLVNQRDGHLEAVREAQGVADERLTLYRTTATERDAEISRRLLAEERLAITIEERDRASQAVVLSLTEKAELREQMAIDQREQGRSLDAVQRELEREREHAAGLALQARQLVEDRADALQRLANVREMVGRLRHAEPEGSATAGYCLRRIEDMLNGQEPT